MLDWDGTQFSSVIKNTVERRGPRTGTFILQAIEECIAQNEDQQTRRLLLASLLSHILNLGVRPQKVLSRSKALYESIREYLESNYPEPLTRESVAKQFYITPSYLSQLFQKEGNLKFNEHLTYIRLEKAKYFLKAYDLKIKEIAHQCGFSDHNYFCRIFKQRTARSPSEYRAQYHSKDMTE